MSGSLFTERGRGPTGEGGVPGTGNSISKGTEVRNSAADLQKIRKGVEMTKWILDVPPPKQNKCKCSE